uniref:Zona pellucida protein AX 4 n=1 Tax=Myripristis murdjan TaxID=586833 RepID=A0A667Z6L3_9TELE
MTCPSARRKEDWSAAYSSATSDWQVMFQRAGQQLRPMSLSEARAQSYVFDVTDGRIVFRTPYGQPDSFSSMVDGVPAEVIHPTLFSRQSWVVIMVDLVAACSMYEGSYDGSHIVWKTPQILYPLMSGLSALDSQVSLGVGGKLLEQSITEERGYIMKKQESTVQISIPYNAEGGYRKSFLMDSTYHEFYVFNLYLEQILVDEDYIETRLRFFRPLATPLLSHPVHTENRTVVEEGVFTVYLGDFPEDVELVAVKINGQDFINTNRHTISKVAQANDTHGYTLRVPFDDPVVETQRWSTATQIGHQLHTDHSKGISFKLDHRPFDCLWEICIGSNPLTPELAAQRGYFLHNDSTTLLLDVPLFTEGYMYKDIGLKTFSGTFQIHVRDPKTLEVQGSSVKTCPFTATELIVCSTDGRMTVVANVSMAIPSGGIPAKTSLLDRNCGPKEADSSRAMFSFGLNTCGTRVKLGKDHVIYENEIVFNQKFLTVKKPVVARNATEKLILQCVYPLVGLYRLFSVHRFESDTPGAGSITQPQQPTRRPTIKPTTTPQTTVSTTERPILMLPAMHPPAHYIKVFGFLKDLTDNLSKKRSGTLLKFVQIDKIKRFKA